MPPHRAPIALDHPIEAASSLFASLDVARTASACARHAAEVLESDEVRVYLLDGSAVRLGASLVAGVSNGRGSARVPKALAQRVTGVAAMGEAGVQDEDGTTLVPLEHDGRPVGVLAVKARTGRNGTTEWRERLAGVATLAGIALGNALAFRETHARAERMADLERAKTQFLNLASHELRGPLTVLMGYLSLLEDGAFGEVPAELAATLPAINTRILEMDSLINAMLETARLEDDRLDLNLSDEDLGDIAADAVGRAEAFAEAGQKLTLTRASDRVPVSVDRARITLAIGNLLNNAIKYSVDRTDVDCEVRVEGEDAIVRVSDHGIGIAAEDLRTLFTRFGRVRGDPRVRAISGTGLGLYLARELARAHGGDVTVESERGRGSVFTLRLPTAR